MMGLSGALRSARSVHPRLGAPNRKKRIRSGRRNAHARQFVPCGGSPWRAQGRRRASSIHAHSRGRKGPFPPCKWPVRSPSFPYRKRPLRPPGSGGSPPLKPANNPLAMWRKSLISAFPSPAREHRAALFQTAGSYDPSASSGVAPSVLAQAEGSSPGGSGLAFKAMRFSSADT